MQQCLLNRKSLKFNLKKKKSEAELHYYDYSFFFFVSLYKKNLFALKDDLIRRSDCRTENGSGDRSSSSNAKLKERKEMKNKIKQPN